MSWWIPVVGFAGALIGAVARTPLPEDSRA